MKGVFKYLLFLAPLWLGACEKEIELDLPDSRPELVVEGTIENERPPIVLISTTQGYFEPTSTESISNSYVSDAEVFVNDSALTRICSNEIPDSLLEQVEQIVGVPSGNLQGLNICLYTSVDSSRFGQVGESYDLRVEARGKTIISTTRIPEPVPPDTLYYELYADRDARGLITARYSDPANRTNFYRIGSRRINPGPDGEPRDPFILYQVGSVLDDRFSNGTTFDIYFGRGNLDGVTTEPGDQEPFLFTNNDTVVVQSAQIDRAAYDFYRSFENQVGSTGSPFSPPTDVDSNIDGGLGIWAGYGTHYDTVYCQP